MQFVEHRLLISSKAPIATCCFGIWLLVTDRVRWLVSESGFWHFKIAQVHGSSDLAYGRFVHHRVGLLVSRNDASRFAVMGGPDELVEAFRIQTSPGIQCPNQD